MKHVTKHKTEKTTNFQPGDTIQFTLGKLETIGVVLPGNKVKTTTNSVVELQDCKDITVVQRDTTTVGSGMLWQGFPGEKH
jgi:hypothetical protein